MFYYHLHTWLRKTAVPEKPKELADMQVRHVEELVELLGDPLYVPNALLHSSIEVSHIEGGSESLTAYAQHLRRMADAIDNRIRRNNFHTVSAINSPANQD